jgi:putative transposase
MAQIARNITDMSEGFLRGERYLMLDRDTNYTEGFCHALTRDGIRLIRLPFRSPNLNVFAERFVRSIKEECLNRMIFVGQSSLRHAITQYLSHYHGERNHQGLGNQLLIPSRVMGELGVPVKRRARLGGMLSYYHREAA